MSLYKKHRPRSFKSVLGNSETVEALKGMLDKNEVPHTLLFHGPTGCGKTTIARILAKELGCKGDDLAEVNSADFRGIDKIREIIKLSGFMPVEGTCRVWIIDECHKLTNDAQNAFLKILEDTPERVYFLLCTTDPNKLIKAIRGRSSECAVKPLNAGEMSRLIKRVVKREGHDPIDEKLHDTIYDSSFGYPRNALQILEQVLSVSDDLREEIAERAAEELSESIELCRALIGGKSWKIVREILTGLKDQEPESIRRHVIGYAQSVLLKSENDRAALVIEELFEPLYNIGFPGLVYACYSITKN